MDKIKITNKAYKTIEQESLNCNTETGGLLIGCLNSLIVVEATPPGRNAELGNCHFTADVEEDTLTLDNIVRKYHGKVSLIGYWHKHPGTMFQPSGGDLIQAQEIVKRVAQSGDKKPLFIFISNVIAGNARIYAYCINYGANEFEPVKLILIDDNSEEVNCALKNEPVAIQTKSSDYWTDSGFQFYFTTRGRERIKQELKELELAGYEAKTLRRQSDKRLFLEIRKDNLSLIVIPPVEYPLGAPRFIDKPTGKEIIKLTTLCNWNSDFTIKQVLDEILRENKKSDTKPVKKGGQNENDIIKTLLRGTFDYAKFVKNTLNEYIWHGTDGRGNNKHFTYWA
ncbi:MAG: Mov34/MPN/PAD-1 family protein [bacterium]